MVASKLGLSQVLMAGAPGLPFSLCFLSEYQGFHKLLILGPKMLPSLWAILSSSQIQLLQLSEGYTGSMLIPVLSLKEQTLTSNEL